MSKKLETLSYMPTLLFELTRLDGTKVVAQGVVHEPYPHSSHEEFAGFNRQCYRYHLDRSKYAMGFVVNQGDILTTLGCEKGSSDRHSRRDVDRLLRWYDMVQTRLYYYARIEHIEPNITGGASSVGIRAHPFTSTENAITDKRTGWVVEYSWDVELSPGLAQFIDMASDDDRHVVYDDWRGRAGNAFAEAWYSECGEAL